ncbi:MAG: type IV toxin-antitoxin system AbiEi family antitoxin domain-containing protein [Clostridia bacterium]|nr:type IV toxin-antitoxin system AbiEi family antitoxin domain-containing protein [Clostridia bacterium]
MDAIWNKMKIVADTNDGYIKTSDVEAAGISRPMIKKYLDAGKLEQVRKGLYVLSDGLFDEFALLQVQSTKAIYSYGTAIFLWGLSDRTPHIFDITLPRGTNVSRLKKDNINLRCHYVDKELYEIGITETVSPQGARLKLYDKERCICDLIRNKDQVDIQIYTQAIKCYFKSNPDSRKLLKYGKVFGIVDKIRTYMEVL